MNINEIRDIERREEIMPEHHPTFPPSSWPALAECPAYRGDQKRIEDNPDAYAHIGTVCHELFAYMLNNSGDWPGAEQYQPEAGGFPKALPAKLKPIEERLSAFEMDSVRWAYEYTIAHTTTARASEITVDVLRVAVNGIPNEDGEVVGRSTFGTADVLDVEKGVVTVIDLKMGEIRNCREQVASYGLGAMQESKSDVARLIALFARFRHVEEWTVSRRECEEMLETLYASRFPAEGAEPTRSPCEYCGWCSEVLTCKALRGWLNVVIEGREDWSLPTLHSSEVHDPAVMGDMLHIARAIEGWAKSVKESAKKLAMGGDVPYGFSLKTRQGNRKIQDLAAACRALDLDPSKFMGICKVSFSDLEALMAVERGVTKTKAKTLVSSGTADLVTRGSDVVILEKERARR